MVEFFAWSSGIVWLAKRIDIDNKDIRTKYWDVRKSGYNKEIMYFYLSRNGFVDVDIESVDKWHLVAIGFKNNV